MLCSHVTFQDSSVLSRLISESLNDDSRTPRRGLQIYNFERLGYASEPKCRASVLSTFLFQQFLSLFRTPKESFIRSNWRIHFLPQCWRKACLKGAFKQKALVCAQDGESIIFLFINKDGNSSPVISDRLTGEMQEESGTIITNVDYLKAQFLLETRWLSHYSHLNNQLEAEPSFPHDQWWLLRRFSLCPHLTSTVLCEKEIGPLYAEGDKMHRAQGAHGWGTGGLCRTCSDFQAIGRLHWNNHRHKSWWGEEEMGGQYWNLLVVWNGTKAYFVPAQCKW